MTSAPTAPDQRFSQANRRLSKAAFEAWLGRPAAGQEIEYYRGHLVWDRGSASRLSARQRQALSRLADAVFSAAGEGRVHLAQRRNGPFDFSYLAIRTAGAGTRSLGVPSRRPALRLPAAA
jgi:hypothetical protein